MAEFSNALLLSVIFGYQPSEKSMRCHTYQFNARTLCVIPACYTCLTAHV
jgi:hypothetical protein